MLVQSAECQQYLFISLFKRFIFFKYLHYYLYSLTPSIIVSLLYNAQLLCFWFTYTESFCTSHISKLEFLLLHSFKNVIFFDYQDL